MSKRSFPILLVTLLVALFAYACSSSPDKPDGLVTEPAGPSFLELIPTDTPYVFAAINPMPLSAVMDTLGSWGKVYDEMLTSMESEVARAGDPDLDLALSLMQELRGKWSRDGLESLGLSTSPRFALYGIGILPAFRTDLKDPKLFLEFLGRIEAKAGLTPQLETMGGTEYRIYRFGEGVVMPLAVVGQELVVGATPVAAQASYLPYLLGEQKPERSFATANPLEGLASTYGLQSYGLGYVDVRGIAAMFIAPQASGLNAEIMQLLDIAPPEPISAACQAEMMDLVDIMPRAVMGYEVFTDEEIVSFAGVELTNGLGADLAQTKTAVPGWDTDHAERAMIAGGFGIDIGKLLDVVRLRMANLRDQQFECEELQPLTMIAAEGGTYLQMVPPVVSQIRGLGLILEDLTVNPQALMGAMATAPPGAAPPVQVRGVALLASADAVSLLDTLKLFIAQLGPVMLKPDARPAALPPLQGLQEFVAPHLVLSPKALALSSGEGMQEEAAYLVTQTPPESSPWIAFAYDYARLAEKLGELSPGEPTLLALVNAADEGQATIAIDPDARGIFMRISQKKSGIGVARAPASAAPSP